MLFSRNNVFVLGLILVFGFCVYFPGLSGGFILDDYPNIVSNKYLQMDNLDLPSISRATFSGNSGRLKRPVSMLSFAFNIYLTKLDPFYLKLTNVLIHLLNGVLIYVLTFTLLSACKNKINFKETEVNIGHLSILISAAWLLHPINLTGVLYVVQRMTSLSALFTLLGVIFYVKGRVCQLNRQSGVHYLVLSIFPCALLSVLSKENGALIVLYIFVIEFIFFEFQTFRNRDRNLVFFYHLAFIFIPVISAILFLFVNQDWILNNYSERGFSMVERVLTESRVLWHYLHMILTANIGNMSLNHDDIVISTELLSPITTLPSLISLVLVISIAIFARTRMPIISFGIIFFLVGHSMESTILPLEIAFEHRNYLPSYGIILILFYYLLKASNAINKIVYGQLVAIILIGFFSFNTYSRAEQWGDPLLFRFYEVEHKPMSAIANYEMAIFYAKTLDSGHVQDRDAAYSKAEKYFQRSLKLTASKIEARVSLLMLASSNRRQVTDKWFLNLGDYLENAKISSTAVASLNSLLQCQKREECIISDENILVIIRAILKNQSLSGRNGVIMYLDIGRYFGSKGYPVDLVIEMGEMAIEKSPNNIESRIYLAKVYLILGKLDDAREQLISARSIDKFNVFIRDINELENKLETFTN
jgi:protein O-mannosyl-transferase